MPIYEYKCAKCGNELEVMHKVSDPNPTECPKCHEPALARLMSRTSFQLKGGGWGSDLYASAKKDGASTTPASTTAASSGTGASTASTTTTTAAPAAPASSGSGTTGGGSTGSGGSST
ncbi:MAG: zinc ribbon domain-containing protein [Archangium sp.]|nr:zinc ribbon domain-containing protein [Archangium sp.]